MATRNQDIALELTDGFLADGKEQFTFEEAVARTNRSRTSTANLLARMVRSGLLDRVRRGSYVIRQLGVLGTAAAVEDVALAVAAAFAELPHRIAYRTALDEHDLLPHPSKTIQVAAPKLMRVRVLSGRPLHVVIESKKTLSIGATKARAGAKMSDRERALLDAASRPELIGGAAALATAIVAAASEVDVARLIDYTKRTRHAAALRRIGSIADTLGVPNLAGQLSPILAPKGDIDLEPGSDQDPVWRDKKWFVRWAATADEIRNVALQ